MLYADDILMYKPTSSKKDLQKLQQDIDKILKWTNDHGLQLNAAKTNVLPITRAKSPVHLELFIDDSPISVVNSVKYLGVTISSDLSSIEPKQPRDILVSFTDNYTRQPPRPNM